MIALMLVIPKPAYAKANNVPMCSFLPPVIKEDLRSIRPAPLTYDKVFNNSERKLPAIDNGYMYVEYTLDRNNLNPGNRGKYRAVGRLHMNYRPPSKPALSPIYVTLDHYGTFCQDR